MVMAVISNDEIWLMLYSSSFSLPIVLMIHLQVWVYFFYGRCNLVFIRLSTEEKT